jgi:ABC-type sugar transport system substrate-binding protein
MKKTALWLLMIALSIALVVSFTMAGCQAEEAAETTAAAEETTAAETTAAETTAAETTEEEMAEKLVFGNIPVALSDEWNGYSVENFQYAADKKGVEVIVLDAEWDGEKALNNLEDLITQNVDHISVFVYTPEQAQDFINRANEVGIPISFENTKLVDQVTGDYVVDVAFEYREFGYEAAKFVSLNYPDSKLFYCRGLPGMGIVEEYMVGINEALDEFGNVELAVMRDTNWDTETALNATQDVIAAGEEFDVIFANNESMAVGCYNALEDAGMAGDIPIVSTGGGPTGVQMLKDGIIDATIAGPVSLQGLYLFKAMWLYESEGIEPPEKYIAPGVIPITLDNLDENIPWEPSDDLIDMIGGLDEW